MRQRTIYALVEHHSLIKNYVPQNNNNRISSSKVIKEKRGERVQAQKSPIEKRTRI